MTCSRLGYKVTSNIVKHKYFADFDMKSIVGGSYVPSYIPQEHPPGDWGEAFQQDELNTYFGEYKGGEDDVAFFDKL